jgi:hypothetical protein
MVWTCDIYLVEGSRCLLVDDNIGWVETAHGSQWVGVEWSLVVDGALCCGPWCHSPWCAVLHKHASYAVENYAWLPKVHSPASLELAAADVAMLKEIITAFSNRGTHYCTLHAAISC